MATAKLTKTLIEGTAPGSKDIVLRDLLVTGLEVKITPKGRRIYSVYYRNAAGKGKRVKLGTHGAMTLDEARKHAKLLLGKIADGKDPSGERQAARRRITLAEFWERFRDDHSARWTARNLVTQTTLWKLHIADPLGALPLTAVTANEIAALHTGMKRQPTTANRALSLLRSMLNQARDWDYLSGDNPASRVRMYPEKAREMYLSGPQLVAILNAIAEEEAIGGKAAVARVKVEDEDKLVETDSRGITPWQAGLFRLLIVTGARLREIMDARWEFVDWPACALRLPDSKTGKKTVWLNSLAMAEIRRLYEMRRNEVWIIEGRIRGSRLVNPQKPWDRVRDRASRYGEKTDKALAALRLHDLRHSFASFGAAAGLSLQLVGKTLGHAQARTTERYAHIVEEAVKNASETVAGEIKGHIEGTK
jgi:integrase